MYKHLPGRHDQQKHGDDKLQNTVIDAVQSITSPLLTDPHVHESLNNICLITFAEPYTTKYGHLSVHSKDIVANIADDNTTDPAFTKALVDYGLELAKKLGKQQLVTYTSDRDVVAVLHNYDFRIGRPEVDQQIDEDDMGMKSSGRPVFKDRFKSQFTRALAKRGVSTETLLQADKMVDKLISDYNASKVAPTINSLNTYGLSKLHRAMVFTCIRFYNPIS